MSSSGSIFISYRRSDSISETGRIYDRLVAEFGRDHVYKDVDSIPLGSDFAEELDKAVGLCQVLLVIIGKTWVTVTEGEGTRRLDNPDDFVRIEVESALKRNIPVIPILLEGANMPKRTQLPDSLHKLARRNGTQVGYDPRFHADMNRLVKALNELLKVEKSNRKVKPQATVGKSPKSIDIGNGVTLELVSIPGGKFLMGSPNGEGGDSEKPQHEVAVPEFWMGKYPVTQAQYIAVMGTKLSNFEGNDRPVAIASWNDLVKFCEKASKKTGESFRLPSEAEWEYACRAGTTTRYYFGDTLTEEQANFGLNVRETTPVGNYPPNAFGLYDMHGNVAEWCQDHWHDTYDGAPSDGSVWTDGFFTSRVIRGGSWVIYPMNCRSAYRSKFPPGNNLNLGNVGFRVVCSAPRILQ